MRLQATMVALATVLGACGQNGGQGRVVRHAASVLGVPESSLRVTSRSDLTSDLHTFYLVTPPSGPSLVVVVPAQGEVFDSRTRDAFSRVARAEDAVTRLSRIGPERVAAWFGALGGGACPPAPVDQAHFATVTPKDDGGVELSYHVMSRTCLIELAPDGSLRQARSVTSAGPNASTTSSWKSDARN